MLPTTLSAPRLKLVPLRRALLEMCVSDRGEFARMLAAKVPNHWPIAPEIIPFIMGQLDCSPEAAEWLPWAIIERHSGFLVGDTGFKGCPDDQGGCGSGTRSFPHFDSEAWLRKRWRR